MGEFESLTGARAQEPDAKRPAYRASGSGVLGVILFRLEKGLDFSAKGG
jgi:hypothetical protein